MGAPQYVPEDTPGNSLRTLLLAESPYFGGITSHLLTLAGSFPPGTLPVLAALEGRGPDRTLFDEAAARNLTVTHLPMDGWLHANGMRALRSLVRDSGAAVLHTHNYRSTVLGAMAVRDLPLVVTCHGLVDKPWRLRYYQALERYVMRRRARRVIACCRHVADALIRHRIPKQGLTVIHNGAAPPAGFEEEADLEKLRHALGLPELGHVLLFAGRLAPEKGPDLLLEACAASGDWTCVVAGDGPMRPGLEAAAARLGLAVHFVGMRRDLGAWIQAADVVVLPSRREALPMAAIEAAACGRPVAGFNVGGMAEVVTDRLTGLLAPPGDVPALVERLSQLKDPQRCADYGAAARDRWLDRFTPGRMAREVAQVYREVCSG